jgi:uncharacterized membrane protein
VGTRLPLWMTAHGVAAVAALRWGTPFGLLAPVQP